MTAVAHSGTTWVYRCWDRGGQLLYVGITDDVRQRFAHHMKPSSRLPGSAQLKSRLSTVTAMPFRTRAEAVREERRLIRRDKPPLNVSGNPNARGLSGLSLIELRAMGPDPAWPRGMPA